MSNTPVVGPWGTNGKGTVVHVPSYMQGQVDAFKALKELLDTKTVLAAPCTMIFASL